MSRKKILITGPFGSGKTTFVEKLCGKNILKTDVKLTFPLRDKKTTTVAFDFGKTIRNKKTIYVYGTPGKKRFNFMIDVLSKGIDGYIFLLDENGIKNLRETKELYEKVRKTNKPHLIAFNTNNVNLNISVFKKIKRSMNTNAPIIPFIILDKNSVENVFQRLLEIIDKEYPKP